VRFVGAFLVASVAMSGCVAGPEPIGAEEAIPVAGIMAHIRDERSPVILVATHRGAHKSAP